MRAVPIVVYGSVDDEPRPDIRPSSIGRGQFREHIRFLRADGWRTFTVSRLLSELRHGDDLPDRCIAVTFDDGFENVLTAALPEMDGMTATVYPTSGFLRDVGGSHASPPGRMLDARQLCLLRDAGFEVGVHSHLHIALDEMRRQSAEADVVTSKNVVEQAVGAEVSSFAYPYGYYDYSVQRIVARNGFTNAVAVKAAWTHQRDDRWAIARIKIPWSMTVQALETLLSTPRPVVVPERDSLVTVGSRTARRARRMLEAGRL